MATIYEELHAAALSAAFAPRQDGEHAEVYLTRMVRAVFDVPQDVWDSLSEKTQTWYIAAAARLNSGVAIVDCPGFADAQAAAETSDGRELTRQIREIVASHPDWGRQVIAEELRRRGWHAKAVKVGTISTVRSVTLDTMYVLRKLGMLHEEQPVPAA